MLGSTNLMIARLIFHAQFKKFRIMQIVSYYNLTSSVIERCVSPGPLSANIASIALYLKI